MSYLPNFRNDLFISYRRAANETHDKWVDVFCKELRFILAELIGGNVSIWRDADQLGAGDDWPRALQAAVDEAAIFVAVVSRSYFESDECRKELDRFLQRMKGGSGATRKIVPVFKQPPNPQVPPPAEVNALQRHEFFDWTPPGNDKHWREFVPKGQGDVESEFWTSLERLAQDVMYALEEIAGEARRRARGRVFVARVCRELEQHRERLRADLQQRGYIVVPRNEYLWNASDHREAMAADLEGALLCVHLVTSQPSQDPEAAARARLQLVLANEAMKSSQRPPPLVWIQPADSVTPGAAELIEFVKSDLANDGVEYWGGSFEDLKTQVYDKLPAAVPEPKAAAPVEIALLFEESELEQTGALRTLLVDSFGREPKPIKLSGASPKDAERMKRTLAGCTQCLVFWAGQPEEWVDDLLALPELGAHLGRETLCVVLAGERSAEKSVFRSAKASVADATADAAPPALAAFLGLGKR